MYGEIRFIEELLSQNVVFHTVWLYDKDFPEYQDFQQRMKSKYSKELSEVNKFIEKIQENIGGAEQRFFKKQDDADRLLLSTPESYNPEAPDPKNYGLRLYCIRLSEKTVVLLNGDKKTYRGAEYCPNCKDHFKLANRVARAIDTAIHMKEIEIDDEGYILTDEGYKLFIT